MDALHEEVEGVRVVLLLDQHHAVQVFQETLARGRVAFLLTVSKPSLQKSADSEQLLVDDGTEILGAHDHLRVLVLLLLPGHDLGVQGEEQTFLAHLGKSLLLGRGSHGRGLALSPGVCRLVDLGRDQAGQERVGQEDGGASVKLLAVEERLGEKVAIELTGFQGGLGRVCARKEGRMDIGGGRRLSFELVRAALGEGIEKLGGPGPSQLT